jgi:hypothetical protein
LSAFPSGMRENLWLLREIFDTNSRLVSGLARLELSSRSSLFWQPSFHANRSAAGIPPADLAELATKNSRAAVVAPLEKVATVESPRSPRQRTVEELTRNIRQVYAYNGSIKRILLRVQ